MAVNPCASCGGSVCACSLVFEDGSAVPGSGTAGDPYVIPLSAPVTCDDLTALFPEVEACDVAGAFSVLATVGDACTRVILPCPARFRLV